MDDIQEKIFEYYTERYTRVRPSHPVLLEAARDERLTTAYLIQRATECVRRERNGDYHVANPALLVLQQRANREVLNAALLLLESDDPAPRQLAALVLRELPGLDSAPYPYSHEVISHLEMLVKAESDEEVLLWALSAIGWQCHPDGTDILLSFAQDDRASIRRVVGDNLINAFDEDQGIPVAVADALLTFAKDTDSDIRWSVFYDISDFPRLFMSYRDAFIQAAKQAKQDPVEDVREQASKAYNALMCMEKSSDT